MDKVVNAKLGAYVMPRPKAIVSSRGKNGQDNALVVAYCCNCSYDPPMAMVGIVPSRYSYQLIKEGGCFVINLPGRDMKEAYDYLGSHSGRDGDKLKKLGLNVKDGTGVAAPILLDCPVSIECTVVDSIKTGSHEMFIGRVEYVHTDAKHLDAEGKIDFSTIELL